MATDPDITAHNDHVLNVLQLGDLVQFNRIVYSHWGVYVGKFLLRRVNVLVSRCPSTFSYRPCNFLFYYHLVFLYYI